MDKFLNEKACTKCAYENPKNNPIIHAMNNITDKKDNPTPIKTNKMFVNVSNKNQAVKKPVKKSKKPLKEKKY
tara:strand:- start:4387 stop:4605 length:219 start_codon:yes stop_codon:yes gene_type:complete